MPMKQGLLLCILAICFISTGEAQALFNLKTGVESWSLRDELNLVGHSSHPGQFFGFDVYVEKNRALFVPGFHYHRISVQNENDHFNYTFNESHHVHYFTIPLTFGYEILDHCHWNMSAMAGGEISFFYDLDSNDVALDDDMLYGVWTGLTAVLQTEIFSSRHL